VCDPNRWGHCSLLPSAPLWSTAAFQGLGHAVPFYVSSAVATAVLLLAMGVKEPHAEAAEASVEVRAAVG